ncbi:glycosyltransferase [Segetibacter sp. 3557_3]|uniref:glycosyltransferase n=1 Tax=Segetibacter sp. 3557_3 TaxID=2547429 RepID=UPI0010588146|nr:glycosyltransferase family 4 protein [Segetibacter sp. 3557_3]TDH26871.1 glycosyltransferase [Segetibacter sp. 3557_3]
MEKVLHIVSLDVPYPVDYGGVFDLFYKLPALQSIGVKIHLHCFEYGRGEQPELGKYCETVHYYKRNTGIRGVDLQLPYIVSSRNNPQLFKRLLQDNHPILMEGIHCTGLLTDSRFSGRRCFVRLHNVEHTYYAHLANTTTTFLKRFYYNWESKQLLQYEKKVASAARFWPVSTADTIEYEKLGYKQIEYIPLFLPPWQVTSIPGKGSFCLYHGNLSVDENEKAAIWLLENVFSEVEVPFVVAGKSPSKKLEVAANQLPHTCLVADPSETEMQDMIQKAHINVLPSFNATGVKLKLYNALYNGRHCIANDAGLLGTNLADVCFIGSSAEDFRNLVSEVYSMDFTPDDVEARKSILDSGWDNQQSAKMMAGFIWNEGS